MQVAEHTKSKCPTCKAERGEWCVTLDGDIAEKTHWGRPYWSSKVGVRPQDRKDLRPRVIVRKKVQGDEVRLIALPSYSEKAVAAWRRFTKTDDVFGLDVESTGIEELGTYSRSVRTRLIQFGNRAESWALDVANPYWRPFVIELLCDMSKRFVSHNASFDATRVLFEYDIDLGERSIDTLPMAKLLWPGQTRRAGSGLKELCDEYVDNQLSEAETWLHARFMDLYTASKPRKTRLLPEGFESGIDKCRQTKKPNEDKCTMTSFVDSACGLCEKHYLARKLSAQAKSWGWANIALDDPYFTRYAGLDAIYVRRLLDVLARLLKEAGMATLSRTEQRVKRYMTAVSTKGLRVDLEWTRPILAEVEEEFEAAETRIWYETGLKSRSPKMKGWLAEQGVRATSLDKDHLPDLVDWHGDHPVAGPVLNDLVVVSNNSNLLSNLRTIELHAVKGDGFVHPSINTQQAHTGRMSITDPAMQTLAKNGLKGERLRGCFIAREGFALVGADYDSQEIRLGGALSRDPMLMKIIEDNLNQHVLTAESIFPDFVDKKTSADQYLKAKTLDFAQQYGAMPKTIAHSLKISEREAFILWQKWRRTYAGLVEWSDRVSKKRTVRNPFGRVIPRDPYREFANGNYLIQSSGRDVLGQAMCNLADAGWAPYFWLPMHDELIMEVPIERAEEAAEALTTHMSINVLDVPITATGEIIGHRWKGLG